MIYGGNSAHSELFHSESPEKTRRGGEIYHALLNSVTLKMEATMRTSENAMIMMTKHHIPIGGT